MWNRHKYKACRFQFLRCVTGKTLSTMRLRHNFLQYKRKMYGTYGAAFYMFLNSRGLSWNNRQETLFFKLFSIQYLFWERNIRSQTPNLVFFHFTISVFFLVTVFENKSWRACLVKILVICVRLMADGYWVHKASYRIVPNKNGSYHKVGEERVDVWGTFHLFNIASFYNIGPVNIFHIWRATFVKFQHVSWIFQYPSWTHYWTYI